MQFGDLVEVLETGHNRGRWWPARLRYSRHDADKGVHINEVVFRDGTAWADIDMYTAGVRLAPPPVPEPPWWG